MTDYPGAPDYDPQLRREHADVAGLRCEHRHLTTGDGPLAAWRDTTPRRCTRR